MEHDSDPDPDPDPDADVQEKELVQQALREQRQNAYEWARVLNTQDTHTWHQQRARHAAQVRDTSCLCCT